MRLQIFAVICCACLVGAIQYPWHASRPTQTEAAQAEASSSDVTDNAQSTQSAPKTALTDASFAQTGPAITLAEFHRRGVMAGEDPLSQVRFLLKQLNLTLAQPPLPTTQNNVSPAFLELSTQIKASAKSQSQVSASTTKVQSFCEVCILVMQMKERGQPHLCHGLNANYYITVQRRCELVVCC